MEVLWCHDDMIMCAEAKKSIGGAEVFSQGKTKFKGLYNAISRILKLLTIAKLVTNGGSPMAYRVQNTARSCHDAGP